MDVTIEEVQRYRNAEPFKPFFIHLRDGRKYRIGRPGHAGWNGRFVAVVANRQVESFPIDSIDEISPVARQSIKRNVRRTPPNRKK